MAFISKLFVRSCKKHYALPNSYNILFVYRLKIFKLGMNICVRPIKLNAQVR